MQQLCVALQEIAWFADRIAGWQGLESVVLLDPGLLACIFNSQVYRRAVAGR